MKNSILSRNIRYLRRSSNLSQRVLAEQLGLKRNNIASYEAGIVEPRAATFVRIADHFGVEPEDLLNVSLKDNPQLIRLTTQNGTQRSADNHKRPILHLAERRGIEVNKLLARLQDLQGSITAGDRNSGWEMELAELLAVLTDLMQEEGKNNRRHQRTS